jgi:hypothetical protein
MPAAPITRAIAGAGIDVRISLKETLFLETIGRVNSGYSIYTAVILA